jgi:ribosomal protein L37AE/L43A
MKVLMRKMDKLSNEMISKHDVHSCKRKEIKRSTR